MVSNHVLHTPFILGSPSFGADTHAVIPAQAGIQYNKEPPEPAPACRKPEAARYHTGFRPALE